MLQYEWLFGTAGIMLILIILVVGIIINALFLGVALGFVNGQNRELGTTFITALGMAIVTIIPVLGCIIAWYLIKTRHNVGWGGAIVAWILTFIIEVIVIVVIIILFGAALGIVLPFI